MGVRRFWNFLNPNLKTLLKIVVGLIPAWYFVGPYYALLWLGITATRNIMADLIAASGFDVRAWAWDNVNRTNVANSLFWTGFSVPVLGWTMLGFQWFWSRWGIGPDLVDAVVRFLVLSVTNGLYISFHNRLRGFDRTVIKANFFRSVLAWPLATAGSFALGPLGVPSIVQTKIWSDIVAGLIEGTSKFVMRLRLRQRDLVEMFAGLCTADRDARLLAMADILFVWARRDRGAVALETLLSGRNLIPGRSKSKAKLASERTLVADTYGVLADAFASDGHLEALTGAVLSHYSGDEATVLTGFIGEHHDAFAQWLLKHPPRRDTVPSESSSATGSA
jgi:hypothetical protein